MKIDPVTFASCIQTQQLKMSEFTQQKIPDIDEKDFNDLNIQSLNNGSAANIRKRKLHNDGVVHIYENREIVHENIVENEGGDNNEMVILKKTKSQIEVEGVRAVEEEKVYKWDLVWVNIILLGFLHIAAVYGLYLRTVSVHLTAIPSSVVKILGVSSTIGITGGAHRLWTHKSFKANKPLECLLMFMATMTYQNSIYTWARDHRLHHKCSETDGDPHNAKRGFFFSHVGWLLVRKHPEVKEQGKTIDMSDLEANPIVMFQHKYYYYLVFVAAVCIPLSLARLFNIPWDEAFFSCVCYKYVLSVNLTWCINSVAHLYGQRPYDKNIGPTESQLMRYLGFGEGFHNYHHTFPWDYKASEFGEDVRNLTTTFIDFFAWLGWATNLRVANPVVIEKRCERTGGPGREYHMMKHNPDRTFHNIASFFVFAFYMYLI